MIDNCHSQLVDLAADSWAALLVMAPWRNTACRQVALLVSIVSFALSIPLYTHLTRRRPHAVPGKHPWIDAFSVNYHLGVDGISMPLIMLTTFTTILVVLAGWEVIQEKPRSTWPPS